MVSGFESGNYEHASKLAKIKSGRVSEEMHFLKTVTKRFKPNFHVLIPWLNRLRKRVFPDGKTRGKEDQELYPEIEVLRRAMEDPGVLVEWTV